MFTHSLCISRSVFHEKENLKRKLLDEPITYVNCWDHIYAPSLSLSLSHTHILVFSLIYLQFSFVILLSFTAAIKVLQFVGCMRRNVLNKIVDFTTAIIFNRLALGIFRQPEQCREATHFELWRHIIGSCIDFDDFNVFVAHFCSKFFEHWRHWNWMKRENCLSVSWMCTDEWIVSYTFCSDRTMVHRIRSKCPCHCWWQFRRSSLLQPL